MDRQIWRSIDVRQLPSKWSQTEFAVCKGAPTILRCVLVQLMKFLLWTSLNWLVGTRSYVYDPGVARSFQKRQKFHSCEEMAEVIWLECDFDFIFCELWWIVEKFVAVYQDIDRTTFSNQSITKFTNTLKSREINEFNFNVGFKEWIFDNFLGNIRFWGGHNQLCLPRWKFFDQFDAQNWCWSDVEDSLILQTSSWIVIFASQIIPTIKENIEILDLEKFCDCTMRNYRTRYKDPTILIANVSDNLLSMVSWMSLE